MENDTKELLDGWARWASANPCQSLMFPSNTPGFDRGVYRLKSRRPHLEESLALRVDAAVARLNKRNAETGQAVVLYYSNGCKTARVAEEMGVYHSKADMLVKSGIAWLDGALFEQAA